MCMNVYIYTHYIYVYICWHQAIELTGYMPGDHLRVEVKTRDGKVVGLAAMMHHRFIQGFSGDIRLSSSEIGQEGNSVGDLNLHVHAYFTDFGIGDFVRSNGIHGRFGVVRWDGRPSGYEAARIEFVDRMGAAYFKSEVGKIRLGPSPRPRGPKRLFADPKFHLHAEQWVYSFIHFEFSRGTASSVFCQPSR